MTHRSPLRRLTFAATGAGLLAVSLNASAQEQPAEETAAAAAPEPTPAEAEAAAEDPVSWMLFADAYASVNTNPIGQEYGRGPFHRAYAYRNGMSLSLIHI